MQRVHNREARGRYSDRAYDTAVGTREPEASSCLVVTGWCSYSLFPIHSRSSSVHSTL